ncbi:MAG: PAS domain S-box protein [Planctomycetaceae bacterium]
MTTLAQQLQKLPHRFHVCQIYESRDEQIAAAIPFIAQGFEHGEKCLLVADESVGDAVLAAFKAQGIRFDHNPRAFEHVADREALGISNVLDPESVVEALSHLEVDAIADGFTGLRICRDVAWSFGTQIDAEDLIRFEIGTNRFVQSSLTSLLCQFERSKFDGETIHDALRTHPLVLIEKSLAQNPYFESPEILLESARESTPELKRKRADWWVERLKQAHAASVRTEPAEESLKRVAERERKRKEHYRLIAESLPHIVWMARADGYVDFLNTRGEEFLGKSQEEVQGTRWTDIVHPEDAERVLETWQTAVETREYYQTEFRVLARDGSYRWFLSQAFPLRGVNGEVERWIGRMTDIDQRKKTEDEMRLRDRAMQAVSQGILMTDPSQPDNPVIFCSPSFQKMTGYSCEEILGRNCRFLQGPLTDPQAVQALHNAVRNERPCTVEILNYRKDGTTFWNEVSISPVRDEKGVLTHYIGVQADITERRKLEEELRQAQKMETVGQLAGGIAHDFNNLLTIIIGYGDLLAESVRPDAPVHELLEEIRKAVERSAATIRQILTYSSKQVLSPRVLDLNEIVAGTETMIRRAIGEGIELETALHPNLWSTKADAGQIQQILLNLVVNSRDAMPRGGKLSIRTENVELHARRSDQAEIPEGKYVAVSVTDTGGGMTPEVQARIFEPFFTTKEVGRGTGLGLSVVHQVLQQYEGHIEIETEPGRGTSIRILLPQSTAGSVTAKTPIPRSRGVRGSETVLVVEDDVAVRSLVTHFLAESGYTVLEAATSNAAFEICISRQEPIELLLMDVVMPGLGGSALAERLKDLHPEMKVLFMSGYTDDSVLQYGVQQDQVEFLRKPFSPLALAQKVREVLT